MIPEPEKPPPCSNSPRARDPAARRRLRRLIIGLSGLLSAYLVWQFIAISRYGFHDEGLRLSLIHI